jgi:hypothetical protein
MKYRNQRNIIREILKKKNRALNIKTTDKELNEKVEKIIKKRKGNKMSRMQKIGLIIIT